MPFFWDVLCRTRQRIKRLDKPGHGAVRGRGIWRKHSAMVVQVLYVKANALLATLAGVQCPAHTGWEAGCSQPWADYPMALLLFLVAQLKGHRRTWTCLSEGEYGEGLSSHEERLRMLRLAKARLGDLRDAFNIWKSVSWKRVSMRHTYCVCVCECVCMCVCVCLCVLEISRRSFAENQLERPYGGQECWLWSQNIQLQIPPSVPQLSCLWNGNEK